MFAGRERAGYSTHGLAGARLGYLRSMTAPYEPHTEGRPAPTKESDTPVDETPDGDGVHLDAQPVEANDPNDASP